MVIGVDIRTFVSPQLTGVGVYLLEILKNLIEIDKKNQYKLFYNSYKKADQDMMDNFSGFPNVELYSFNYPNKILNSCLFFLKQPKLDRWLDGCDVFWFPNFNFWEVSSECKTVITVHDLSFARIPWAYSMKRRLWHKFIQPEVKLNQAVKILAVSQSTKNDLEKIYHLPKDKIEVVYPGVEIKNQSTDNKPIYQHIFLPTRYILFLGTLEPRKNIEGVIKAFEKIADQDINLVIAGGQGWLYDQIYQSVEVSAKKDKIIFLDYIDQEERWNLYRQAEAFVWPSFYEGFGFPVLEAMSQGCPVITSANSSLPEVSGPAALYVDPYNANELAEAINQLLTDQQLRTELIKRGYEQSQKYNWQTSAQKVLEVFNSLSI